MLFTPSGPRAAVCTLLFLVACRASPAPQSQEPESAGPAPASIVTLEVVRGETLLARSMGFFVGPHELLALHQLLVPLAELDSEVQLQFRTSTGGPFPVTKIRAGSMLENLVLLAVDEVGVPIELAVPSTPLQTGDEVFGFTRSGEEATATRSRGRVLDPVSIHSGRLGLRVTLDLELERGFGILGSPVLDAHDVVLGMLVASSPGSVSTRATAGVPARTATVAHAARSKVVREFVQRASHLEPRPLATYVAELLAVTETPGQIVTPGADGDLVLSAAAAQTHGTRVQFERKGLAYNIGYWTEVDDYLTWELDLPAPGRFVVSLISSCPDSTAHTPVTLEAAEDQLTFEVPATGSFLTFFDTAQGYLNLPAGRSTVTLRPNAAPPLAVMDLDRFELHRVPPPEQLPRNASVPD